MSNNIKFEMDLMEDLWQRKQKLIDQLQFEQLEKLSLYEICSIIYPENVELACSRMCEYLDQEFDEIDEIYERLSQISWIDDVRDLQPVASIINEYYSEYVDDIIDYIEVVHAHYETDNLQSAFHMTLFHLGLRDY